MWRRPGVEAAAEAGGGSAHGRARRAHARRPSGAVEMTTGVGQLGWAAQCWAIWWAGRWAVPGKWPGTSLSLSFLI